MKIDEAIPPGKVLADARQFLSECEWKLEIDGVVFDIPPDTELRIQTRAYIVAHAPNILLGDHFEAVVMLGCEEIGASWVAQFGFLKMYYNSGGNFVTEGRYGKHGR